MLHVDVHRGHGPPLLLVHGLLAGRSLWLRNLEALAEVATPVVVELLGHGRSPSPADPGRYRPGAYVEHFEAVRRALGVERWVVCGQSLGAALTLRYALDRPERVAGHVLTNSLSALGDDAWRRAVGPLVDADARRIDEGGREAIAAHRLNPARSRRLPTDVRAALAADVALHHPPGVAATLRHTVPTSSSRHRLHEHRPPALLVAGEREAPFRELRRFAQQALRGLEVVTVDVGHAVPLEAPEVFNRAVAGFLHRLAPGDGR